MIFTDIEDAIEHARATNPEVKGMIAVFATKDHPFIRIFESDPYGKAIGEPLAKVEFEEPVGVIR